MSTFVGAPAAAVCVLEVLAQSCNFAYMNRYTDWLRLPSEEEAIKIYQGTYDKSFEEQRTNRQ